MAVPTRVEACRLLLDLDPPRWLVEHSTVVAEVAAFLAERIRARGGAIDRRLAETSALLHDLDKALPADHRLRELEHGRAGAAWLAEHGFGELSAPVADHPVTRLTEEPGYERWAAEASLEDRVVAYADKRALQRLVPMRRRFAEWRRRYPDYADRQQLGRQRAERLEHEVCDAAGVKPERVRRLRWVATAIRAAQ
jgi:putative nucleotidyltransferase with HDIG domain